MRHRSRAALSLLAGLVAAAVTLGGTASAAAGDRGRPAEPRTPATLTELSPELRRLLAEVRRAGPMDDLGIADWELPDDRVLAPVPGRRWTPDEKFVDLTHFDRRQFERNLREVMDAKDVGYAYSIGIQGRKVAGGGVGDARTVADLPQTPQSEQKPMTVASMSKTITAVLMLRLLEAHGIGVDDPIGPWLPSAWERGDGVNEITFRELMTHTSGLRQNYQQATGDDGNPGGRYDVMRTAVAWNIDADDPEAKEEYYGNLNFGIFRLMAPIIAEGLDLSGLYDNPPDGVTSDEIDQLWGAAFDSYVGAMLGSIGVTGGCTDWDPQPSTRYYRYPYDYDAAEPEAGASFGPYLHRCGGYGFFLSADGLTAFLSYLRYTDQLLSPESRALMAEGLLGLNSWNGAHGTYLGHGGRWQDLDTGRGMRGCMISFTATVEASLLVNFRNDSTAHPCAVLRQAFDNAWT